MNRLFGVVAWVLALYIALLDVWYFQYKFTGHPGSVHLFTILTDWLGFPGYEHAMRIGVGVMEGVSALLLVIPRRQVLGAGLAMGIITGAIFFHIVSPLGIDPYGDGGVLFKEAVGVWFASLAILAIRWEETKRWIDRIFRMVGLKSGKLVY